jgi:hypothetical protein
MRPKKYSLTFIVLIGLAFSPALSFSSSEDEDDIAKLFKAIDAGDLKETQMLVFSGVDPKVITDADGKPPLERALLANQPKIVSFLRKQGTSAIFKNRPGAFVVAVNQKSPELIDALLPASTDELNGFVKGASVDYDQSPMYVARETWQDSLAEKLLDAGAQLNPLLGTTTKYDFVTGFSRNSDSIQFIKKHRPLISWNNEYQFIATQKSREYGFINYERKVSGSLVPIKIAWETYLGSALLVLKELNPPIKTEFSLEEWSIPEKETYKHSINRTGNVLRLLMESQEREAPEIQAILIDRVPKILNLCEEYVETDERDGIIGGKRGTRYPINLLCSKPNFATLKNAIEIRGGDYKLVDKEEVWWNGAWQLQTQKNCLANAATAYLQAKTEEEKVEFSRMVDYLRNLPQ